MYIDFTNAWCAGLFEGEGNIHLSTQYDLMVTVVNTQRELLEPFLAFGGVITARGKPEGQHRQVYQWRIGGADMVKEFITKLQPFLVSKKYKSKFTYALEFIDFTKAQPKFLMNRDMRTYELFRTKVNKGLLT